MAGTLRTWGAKLAVALVAWLVVQNATAQVAPLPPSLAQEALSEHAPSAIAPADFDAADFVLERTGGDEPGAHVWLERGSVQWVRVSKWMVVPRALLVVNAPGATGGRVSHAGFSHPLTPSGPTARALVPVVLLASEGATVDVAVVRGNVHTRVSYEVRFRPRPQHRGRLFVDSSCSGSGVHAAAGELAPDSWMHVACRMVRTARGDGTSPTLELYVVWDQPGGPVTFNGAVTDARIPALYTYRVTRGPGSVRLGAGGHALTLAYFLPMEYHAGFVGAGVGPYYYAYDRPEREFKTVAPVLTVYAAYSFTPAARAVFFNATTFHRHGFSDSGLYLWTESTRFFDERISFNILLGANLLVYHRVNKFVWRINAPQGIEFIFRDFLARNRGLTVGGFLYPDISGSAYYNAWLRWGSPRFFGEINYLYWREPFDSGPTKTQTLGVTFGMPLFRFL
jgi:hypothetical protein